MANELEEMEREVALENQADFNRLDFSQLGLNPGVTDIKTSSSNLSPLFAGDAGIINRPAPSQPQPLFNANAMAKVNQAGRTKKDTQIPNAKISSVKSLAPLSAGIGAGQKAPAVQGGSAGEAAVGVGGAVLSGAISGAIAGAPAGGIGIPAGALIGGASALVISGVNAWFGVRSARRKNREMKALQSNISAQRAQDIARAEKWAKLNHFSDLRVAAENRNQTKLKNEWATYGKVQESMTALFNSDQNLNQMMRNQMLGVS